MRARAWAWHLCDARALILRVPLQIQHRELLVALVLLDNALHREVYAHFGLDVPDPFHDVRSHAHHFTLFFQGLRAHNFKHLQQLPQAPDRHDVGVGIVTDPLPPVLVKRVGPDDTIDMVPATGKRLMDITV